MHVDTIIALSFLTPIFVVGSVLFYFIETQKNG